MSNNKQIRITDWFKTKEEKKMDEIINRMIVNMSNNYKDNAQDNFRELEQCFGEMKQQGILKEKTVTKYEGIISEYKEKLKGYSHKDQKPYWT
ncbi:MAG: hypothetical protein PUE21_01965 [Lachnospiraceae bacterium]|nr:hypothetical protein [Lachnospiraceae bacterium]